MSCWRCLMPAAAGWSPQWPGHAAAPSVHLANPWLHRRPLQHRQAGAAGRPGPAAYMTDPGVAAHQAAEQLSGLDLQDSSSQAASGHTAEPEAAAEIGWLPVKFLLPNAAAGSIIGKQGESINRIQQESEARLQLSKADEFFPGTNDRVLLISGSLDVVMAGLQSVLDAIQEEESARQTMLARDGDSLILRMLVPVPLCGCIIGKDAAVLRSIMDGSQAQIAVSSQDQQPPGLPERKVRMIGGPEQLMLASRILQKLLEEPSFSRFFSTSLSYPAQPAHFQLPAALPHDADLQPGTELTMAVNEARMGAVIGRGGQAISQLKSLVGVRILISSRGDFFPGTQDRKVTIWGTEEAVQIAQALIMQKVNAPGSVQ